MERVHPILLLIPLLLFSVYSVVNKRLFLSLASIFLLLISCFLHLVSGMILS